MGLGGEGEGGGRGRGGGRGECNRAQLPDTPSKGIREQSKIGLETRQIATVRHYILVLSSIKGC